MDVQGRLDAAVDEGHLAGVAAAVVQDGEVVALGAAGDSGGGRPVETTTPFLLASITKTFVGIAVMQLVEQGRFDLDDPVDHHLRSVTLRPKEASFPPVTVRHLLTHTAGIGELRTWRDLFQPVVGLGGLVDPDYYRGGLTIEVPPGSKWAYANHGFGALGKLIEDVTGEALPHYVRDHLLEPLGMTATGFGGPRALGFTYKKGKKQSVPVIEVANQAAGGLVSTAEDMGRYLGCLLTGGGPLLRPETLATMLHPHHRPAPGLLGMGLAFQLEDLAGHRVAGHDGGWAGAATAMVLAPDEGWGVIVLTNTTTPGRQHALALDLLAEAFGADRTPADVAPPTHLFADLAGSYRPEPGWNTNMRFLPLIEVEVVDRGDHLQVKPFLPLGELTKDLRLRSVDPAEPRLFELEVEGLRVPILFTEDGHMVADFPFPALRKRTGFGTRRAQLRAAGAVLPAAMAVVSTAARRRRRSGPTA